MKGYGIADLAAAFGRIGVKRGDTLLVHSSLMALGRITGVPAAATPSAIYGSLREVIGDEGTIVVPAFNFGFCRGEPFDPGHTPSVMMGVFSEYVRTLPSAKRSPHPMQSVAAIGPRAAEICGPDTASSFGPGSAFEVMHTINAKVVLIGTPIQSVSLVHLGEERAAVPYRYWKDFCAPYVAGGRSQPRTYRMFVRDLEWNPQLVLSRIEDGLVARGQFAAAKVGGGIVAAFVARDFIEVLMENLRKDPFWLLCDRSRQGIAAWEARSART